MFFHDFTIFFKFLWTIWSMVTGVNWMPFQLAKNDAFLWRSRSHRACVGLPEATNGIAVAQRRRSWTQRPLKRYARPSWEPRYHQNLLKMGLWGKNRSCCYPGKKRAPLDARNWLIWWLRPSVHIHWSYGRVSWYCSLFFGCNCMVWNCCQRLTLIHNHSFFSLALSFTTTW